QPQPPLGCLEVSRILRRAGSEAFEVGVGRHLRRRLYFLEAKLLVELIVRLAVDLDIWIDEIVERRPILLGGKGNVTPAGELQAIGVDVAKEIISLFLRLPRL